MKSRKAVAESYSSRNNSRLAASRPRDERAAVHAFRSIEDIPDRGVDDIDYGIASLDAFSESYADQAVASNRSSRENQRSSHNSRELERAPARQVDEHDEYDYLSDDDDEVMNYSERKEMDRLSSNTSEGMEEEKQRGYEKSYDEKADDALVYSRKPRAVKYKPYTLAQYRLIKPSAYAELANARPDLNTEELKAKRANRDRVKMFARNLHEYNHALIEQTRLVGISNDCADGVPLRAAPAAAESARDRALAFARSVPRPRAGAEGAGRQVSKASARTGPSDKDKLVSDEEVRRQTRLLELESKHSFDRQQVLSIRKAIGM